MVLPDSSTDAIDAENLASILESDLDVRFAYEDSMLVISEQECIRKHMHLLKLYFKELHPVSREQSRAIRLFQEVKYRRLIAEDICSKTGINSPSKQAIKSRETTLDRGFKFDRLRVPENPPVRSQSSDEDESDDNEVENVKQPSNIDALEIKGLEHQLTQGSAFLHYKSMLKNLVREQCSSRTLRSAARIGSANALAGLLSRHFDAFASEAFEWLQELYSLGYSYHDMAELLLDDINESPWICFTQPEPHPNSLQPEFHIPNCVHCGISEVRLGSRLNTDNLHNTEQIVRLIAEHCGLAGVVPKSREPKDWTGLVTLSGDSQSIASVTYHTSRSCRELARRVCEVFQRFCGTASYLQKEGLCCDSFTVLRYPSCSGLAAVELCRIDFRPAADLLAVLQLLVNNFENPGLVSRCLPRMKALSKEINCTIYTSQGLYQENRIGLYECLDSASLAAQILTLGLFLYSQAHTGVIHPFFLMKPLSRIRLLGTQTPMQRWRSETKALVEVDLIKLTCMAGVTGDLVAVFCSCHSSDTLESDQAYDLLASPEDLADTWDVWNFIIDTNAPCVEMICGIEVGGGIISAAEEFESLADLENVVTNLHWSRESRSTSFKAPFHFRTKALIGATSVNRRCPMDGNQSWVNAHVAMDTLGAEESFWERSEAHAGLQGGQYVVAQFNVTWVKRPGSTLKHIHLRPDINLPFLQSDWGLQISYCTGVAQRVSLCTLLADVIPDLIEPLFQKPDSWTSLNTNYNIIGALHGNNFKSWFESLNRGLQDDVYRVVRYVLLVLQDTGIDRSGDHLVAIWPHKSDPLRCFKIPCKKATSWAQMLADSPNCATFAYITSLCLETDECKCQKQQTPLWHNKSFILNTAVSRHVCNDVMTTGSWVLKHAQSYLIGPVEKCLLGKAVLPSSPATMYDLPRLHISSSKLTKSVLPRVRVWISEREHIREKQYSDARAQRVMVLAKN